MKYNFDRTPSRKGSDCVKFDACPAVFGRGDVIPLWIADMDFEVAPCIIEAMRLRLEHPVFGYGLRNGGFYGAINGWLRERNGWEVQREWISFTPGVVAGFTFAIRALSEPGEGVVIQPPVYPPFAASIKSSGRRVVTNPLLRTDEGWQIDFEDLDRKLSDARLLLLCNPHNPTGRVFTREELERIGELCRKHNVVVISDEIHSDLIQKPYRHIHIASLSDDMAARTVTLVAPSKTFNIAGLSTSVAIVQDDSLRRRFRGQLESVHVDQGNIFGTVALEAAYTNGADWLEELIEYVGGNMDYVIGFLKENLQQIKTWRSQSTYMLWLDMSGLGMSQADLMHFLIFQAGLGLNDGMEFGKEGTGFVRLNVGTSRAVLQQAMQQLKEAVDAL